MTDQKGCIMWQKLDKKNDVTNRTRVVYIEIETKSSWPIGQGVIYDKN